MIKIILFTVLLPAVVSLCPAPQPQAGFPAPRGIWSLEFSPDGKYFALGGDDSTLHIYNAKDHKVHQQYKLNSMIRNITWHPGGKRMAISTLKDVRFFDPANGSSQIIPGIPGARGIGWNATGTCLGVADGYGVVHIIDQQGQVVKTITKHNRKSYLTMDWNPAGDIIATGTDEIILFDTTGKQVAFIKHREEQTGVLTVRWHPGGEYFASGDYGHEKEGKPTLLQFWKTDGTLVRSVKGHHEEIRNLRWNKDGSLLATASDALRIYNKDGELLATGQTEKYDLWGISWSPDGNTIITASYGGDHVDVWNTKGKLLKRIH